MKEKFIPMNVANLIDFALDIRYRKDSMLGTKEDLEFLKKKKQSFIVSFFKN